MIKLHGINHAWKKESQIDYTKKNQKINCFWFLYFFDAIPLFGI